MTRFDEDVATMRARGLCAESDGDGCLCALTAGHREPHGWMSEDAKREFAVKERIRAAVAEAEARAREQERAILIPRINALAEALGRIGNECGPGTIRERVRAALAVDALSSGRQA